MRRSLRSLRRLALAAALLLPAPLGAAAEGIEPVALKHHAVIHGDIVRLGDLFEGLGGRATTAVARAPAPGRQVELDARWLSALARSHEIAWRPQTRFDRIMVERASLTIPAEQIRDALLVELTDRMPEADFEISLDNPALRLVLPLEAEGSLAVNGLVYHQASGRFRAQLVSPAQGTPQLRRGVSGRALRMAEVPVLRRRVAPGEAIGEDDVGWLRIRHDRSRRGIVRDIESLTGKSPRRPISVDQPVRLSDLREPVVVAKNNLVVIRLKTDRMTLTAQGRALEDGSAGAGIRVMNTKSNTVINATVVQAGLVEVVAATQVASQ